MCQEGVFMFWAMNQSEKSISKRKKLSRFRVYKPVGNPVVPELFQEKKFPLELDPVLGLILAEANIAHLLTSSYRWPLWLQTKIPKMNTLQTPLILVITSLGQLQVLSWFLFWFEIQFPGTWITDSTHWEKENETLLLPSNCKWIWIQPMELASCWNPIWNQNMATTRSFIHVPFKFVHLFEFTKNCSFGFLYHFRLRELLVLVLWGKKSRNQRTASPGYFKTP